MGERVARLIVENKEVDVDSDRTHIFQHLGSAAVYDHIYFTYPDGEKEGACYLWNDHIIYEDVLQSAQSHEVAAHVNLRAPSDRDVEAFVRHHTTDLEDTLPEQWPKQHPDAKGQN